MSCLDCKYFVKKYMNGDADGYCNHFKEEINICRKCRFFENKHNSATKRKEEK